MARRSKPFCSDISRQAGEPLAATASRVDHWLLIEYPGLWSRDVLGGSLLSPEVKSHLQSQLGQLTHARLLFIRRPERRGAERRKVYVVRTAEEEGDAFQLEIDDYADLAELDVADILAGHAAPLSHPLLIVCTHGKRDRCCARYGQPLFDRLAEATADDWLWQSTHLGGDRFAGNLVCLPEGLNFGRVDTIDAWAVLDEYLAGRIALGPYRGRSCFSFPEQAAERAVREATGLTGIDDVRLMSSARTAPGQWVTRFSAGDDVHEMRVIREEGELTYLTCDAETLKHPRRFVVASEQDLSR
jgi:hypothetical protein